jgi:hypothetical protein
MWFYLQPKSATEIGLWLLHSNIGKYNKTYEYVDFSFSVNCCL